MSEATTQAQYLYEKYIGAGALELLKSLPTLPEKTFENDWLDFKSGKVQDADIKKIWSKIIGAFANNSGGVVVWGLIAKKDSVTGIDAVSGIELVPDVFALKSRLMELRHGANDPPVANIEIKELQLSSGKPEGFVVCHIPESSNKPHRSEFFERHFFLRMGDSSRECSVSLLRQLFYPKRNPRIEATIKTIKQPNLRLSLGHSNANHIRSAFEIGVRNIGEISINDVQVHIESAGYKILSFRWNTIQKEYDVEFLPEIVSFGSSIHPKIRQSIYIVIVSESAQDTRDIFLRVFAKDMLPRDATLSFPKNEGESASSECLP
jgi:hypothetical protein